MKIRNMNILHNLARKQITLYSAVASAVAVALAVVLFAGGFRYTYPKELVAADSLCESKPDSAMAILNKFSAENSKLDKDTKWYLRFLRLKSKVKLNEPEKNDNEVKSILDYYEDIDDRKILPQVYYCAGCIYNSLNDTPQALDYFMKAANIFENDSNKEYLGLCYYQLGHIFSMQGLHKDALTWHRKALFLHKSCKNDLRCIYDYEDLAWTLGCLGNTKMSLSYMKAALRLAESIGDKVDIPEIESQIALHYSNAGSLHLAKKYIDSAMHNNEGRYSNEIYSIALRIYAMMGVNGKANEYSRHIINKGDIFSKQYAYLWQAMNSVKNNDGNSALNDLHMHVKISDSIQISLASEASAKANALYNYKIRAKENMELEKKNSRNVISIVLTASLLVIASITFVFVYLDNKKKRKIVEARCRNLDNLLQSTNETYEVMIKRKETEIKKIKEQLSEYKERDELRRLELENRLNSQKHELEKINYDVAQNKLCNSCFRKTKIYKELVALSEESQHHKFSSWGELEQTIYKCYPNFEDRIHGFEKMSDVELYVCLLLRCGFNATVIGKFLCKNQTSIYSISKRLYYKNFRKTAAASVWEKLITSIY